MAGKQRVLVCNVAGAYDMPYFIILLVTNTALQGVPLYFSIKAAKKLRSDMVFYSSSARYQFAGYLYGGASQNNASETKSSDEACAMVLVSSRLPCL
jgi:hypothetical protein